MEPLGVFLGLLVPTMFLSYLSAGRDEILGQARSSMRLGTVVVLTAVAVVVLVSLGVGWSWALALASPGVLGSRLGDWLGRGGWAVFRRRVRRRSGGPRSDATGIAERGDRSLGASQLQP